MYKRQPSNHKYDIQDYDYIDPHYGKIVNDGGEPLQDWDKENAHASKYIQRVTAKMCIRDRSFRRHGLRTGGMSGKREYCRSVSYTHLDVYKRQDYNQHNVWMLEPREEKKIAVTNFDGWNYDVQIADLYQFMRKILEKHDWDFEIGKNMLNKYQDCLLYTSRCV